AIEDHRNAVRLRLPRSQRFLGVTAMPGQGGCFIGPGRLPLAGAIGLMLSEQLGRLVELAGQAQGAVWREAQGEVLLYRYLCGPAQQRRRRYRPASGRTQLAQAGAE